MTRQRALRLAREWSQGHGCSLRDGEAEEYHAMFATMLEESMPNEPLTLEDVAQANIDKLRKRYPDGFSAERSLHRDNADTDSMNPVERQIF